MAFVSDANEAPEERTLPALRGAELAFAAATLSNPTVAVDLVPIDLAADPSGLADVAADRAYVAAIVAPGVPGAAARELLEAGLTVVDLSSRGDRVAGVVGTWRRLVPPLRVQAAVLAAHADGARGSRAGACVLEDPATSIGLARHAARALHGRVVLSGRVSWDEVAEPVRRSGCPLLLWDGDGESAARVASLLASGEPPRITLLGGDRLRDAGFLADAGAAAEGTVSACGCADLSTSTSLRAQRFIQDFQSEYGLAPGPHAVEAWDAAHLILETLGEGVTRDEVAGRVAGISFLDGLASDYWFAASGELADPRASVRLAEVRGGRWIPLADGP
ncbi:MAG TPA: hypothetical protein VF029_01370 [Actinomycetota bacterium]